MIAKQEAVFSVKNLGLMRLEDRSWRRRREKEGWEKRLGWIVDV